MEEVPTLVKKEKSKRKSESTETLEKKVKLESDDNSDPNDRADPEKKTRYKHPLIKIFDNCFLHYAEFKNIRGFLYDPENELFTIRILCDNGQMETVGFKCDSNEKKNVEDKILSNIKTYRGNNN